MSEEVKELPIDSNSLKKLLIPERISPGVLDASKDASTKLNSSKRMQRKLNNRNSQSFGDGIEKS